MDEILPIPRDEIVRQGVSLKNSNETMLYQKHVLDVLEKLVKDGKYDAETIKTKCCVDVDEKTGDIDGLDLFGLDGQGPLCIGLRVPIGQLTADQWT